MDKMPKLKQIERKNALKTLWIVLILIIINTGLFFLIISFYNIMEEIESENLKIIILLSTVYMSVIINCILVYHIPYWVDSWIKGKGEWWLRQAIGFYNDILDREEVTPDTLKDIYDKNLEKTTAVIKNIFISKGK